VLSLDTDAYPRLSRVHLLYFYPYEMNPGGGTSNAVQFATSSFRVKPLSGNSTPHPDQ